MLHVQQRGLEHTRDILPQHPYPVHATKATKANLYYLTPRLTP